MAKPIARVFASAGGVELLLTEEITQNTAERLIAQLSAFKGKPIDLSIYSQGGNAEAAFAIYDYITAKDNDMHITAKVYGMAASGAMIIAAGCEKRLIGDSSFAMAHYAYALNEDLNEVETARLNAMNERQIALFQQITGKGRVEIKHLLDEGADMHAKDAVAFGLFNGTIEQARLAALITPKKMAEDTKPATRALKVGHKILLAAALTKDGTIDIPEELIAQADADKVKELDDKIAALTTERDTLKAKADTVPTLEAAKTEAEGKLVAMTTAHDTMKLKVEALEKNPLVAGVLSSGNEVVIPGAETKPAKPKSKKEMELEAGANAWEAAKKEYFGEPATA